MYLIEIKEIASKFAETISKILNIDVIIIDDKYNMIGNTYYYTNEPTPVSRYSMLGEVMQTGKVVAVSDKSTYKHCKNCPDLNECAISGLVSVPIFFLKIRSLEPLHFWYPLIKPALFLRILKTPLIFWKECQIYLLLN